MTTKTTENESERADARSCSDSTGSPTSRSADASVLRTESDLTKRAREVLAGLDGNGFPFASNPSGAHLVALSRYIERHGGELAPCSVINLLAKGLESGGLIVRSSSAKNWCRLTDLGREVARLLAEGGR